MRVSWPHSEQVTAGLEQYYHYVIEVATSGQDPKPAKTVKMGDNTTDVTGLKYNTLYNVRVRIDAEHGTRRLEGQSGNAIGVKTKCRGRCLYSLYVNHFMQVTHTVWSETISSSAFPHSGPVHRAFNLHVLLSSTFTRFSFMSFLITSLHLSFGLLIFRCPPTSTFSLLHLLQSFSPHVLTISVSLIFATPAPQTAQASYIASSNHCRTIWSWITACGNYYHTNNWHLLSLRMVGVKLKLEAE